MVMHDASCPQETLGNKMARAQFIVPLQRNYNQSMVLTHKDRFFNQNLKVAY